MRSTIFREELGRHKCYAMLRFAVFVFEFSAWKPMYKASTHVIAPCLWITPYKTSLKYKLTAYGHMCVCVCVCVCVCNCVCYWSFWKSKCHGVLNFRVSWRVIFYLTISIPSRVTPFRVTAGSKPLAVIPLCRESVSTPFISVYCSYCLLKQVIEGKIKGEMEVARRRGRRRKKLLDDLKDRRGYSHLKEEALDRTMWRHRFGGGFGPVVRQNAGWMNDCSYKVAYLLSILKKNAGIFFLPFIDKLYVPPKRS